jgi:hypothetical protein
MISALLTLALVAQPTLTVTVKPSTPFTITWDQPEPSPLPSFRLWCDGAIVKNYLRTELVVGAANADGSVPITAQAPGLAVGQHACFVSAWNENGEAKGAPIQITVAVATGPATPINLRIVVTVGGGGQ